MHYSLFAVCRFTVVASLVSEHRIQGTRTSAVATPTPQSTGSIVAAHGLSCSVACRDRTRFSCTEEQIYFF